MRVNRPGAAADRACGGAWRGPRWWRPPAPESRWPAIAADGQPGAGGCYENRYETANGSRIATLIDDPRPAWRTGNATRPEPDRRAQPDF